MLLQRLRIDFEGLRPPLDPARIAADAAGFAVERRRMSFCVFRIELEGLWNVLEVTSLAGCSAARRSRGETACPEMTNPAQAASPLPSSCLSRWRAMDGKCRTALV